MTDDTRKRAEELLERFDVAPWSEAEIDLMASALRSERARGLEEAADMAQIAGVFPGIVNMLNRRARSIREGR